MDENIALPMILIGTMLIAIMDLGLRLHAVDETTNAVVITGGIIASLLFPSAARRLLKAAAEDMQMPDKDEETAQAAAH